MLSEVHSVFICAVSLTRSVSLFSTFRLTAQPLPQICPFLKIPQPNKSRDKEKEALETWISLNLCNGVFSFVPAKVFSANL